MTLPLDDSSPPVPVTPSAAPWVSDLGDGTYRNPVLFADYSDPDAIRVGDDYWMTASSFNHVPGLPILHSRDLVNWELVNHALPALVPVSHFSQPRHGQGVWAPSIRYHAGRFWIFYPDPDFGIYVITADDPRGPWSEPVLVKSGKGLIDPCPLWDDDGQVYLVHGWAKSRSGICNLLTLHRLSADAMRVVEENKIIIDANLMSGWTTLEGPKLYKRDGFYYIFAPAGGVAEGYQAVFRARDIWGPYEARIVLEQGSTTVNGPHQGAWVDTPAGEHWFFHFQEIPAYGRVVHLQPMQWREDGWPAMGRTDADGKGEPVLVHRKPILPPQPIAGPATTDDFASSELGRQWQWQANPDAAWYSVAVQPGVLCLRCAPVAVSDSHWLTPHLLMQKFPAPAFTASVVLQLNAANEGDAAGLMVFGHDYAWLGLVQRAGRTVLVHRVCLGAHQGGREEEVAVIENEIATAAPVHLRVSVGTGAVCRFSFSVGGRSFTSTGTEFQAKSGYWVGAKVGVFAAGAPGRASEGFACFENFVIGA